MSFSVQDHEHGSSIFILHPFALILLRIPLLYPGHIAKTAEISSALDAFLSSLFEYRPAALVLQSCYFVSP